MRFENEQTFNKFVLSKKEDLFHDRYELALQIVKSEFGKVYPLIIGGKKIMTQTTFALHSPIDTRITLGYFSRAASKDTINAINAARDSFEIWRNYDYKRRIKICAAAAERLRRSKFEIAAWLSYENGKNRYEAMADVDEAIDFIRYYCASMETNRGFSTPMKSAHNGETSKSVMKSYGVWAVIAPFNFPAAILVGMSIGALITGNTVIIKPASTAPTSGYKFVEIMHDVGLPDGIINFITGPGTEFGRNISRNEHVAGIAFTGSVKAGHEILRRFNRIIVRPAITELGGKNPAIVTESADLEQAAYGITNAAFGYAGQKCSACSIAYVQKKIKRQFVEELVNRNNHLKVGNPLERNTFVGPLISMDAYKNYRTYVRLASRDGRILMGGRVCKNGELRHGFYVEPTIIEGLLEKHWLLANELFVPILCLIEYDNIKDAIRSCNRSKYGLTAGIYSKNKEEIEKFIEGIESGVIYVNRAGSATTGAMVGCQSFVGWKKSGTTGLGSGGPYYLTQFMHEQSQTIGSIRST
jgi:1-pyrroline-5-carboxylate dehydrogenase